MGSIYSPDYDAGYAHICDVDHSGGNGLPDPDTSGQDSTDSHTTTDSTDTSYHFPRLDNSKIYIEDVYGAVEAAGVSAIVGLATGGIGWFGTGVAIEVGATIASAREGIRQGTNNDWGGQ
ncbi:hypothetical protein J7L68_07285 [bacterium]|nr:hypothetical protein [bacterium]